MRGRGIWVNSLEQSGEALRSHPIFPAAQHEPPPMADSSLKPIPVASPVLDGNERKYGLECLDTTWISSGGRFIGLFEQAIAQASGTKLAVATNNGTTALHLVLAAMGIKEGDEVIVPTLTYIASANAVRYCNATPVFI